jgi:hypothetical protein
MKLCPKGKALIMAANAIAEGRHRGEKTSAQWTHSHQRVADHILSCPECQKDPLVAQMARHYREMFPEETA